MLLANNPPVSKVSFCRGNSHRPFSNTERAVFIFENFSVAGNLSLILRIDRNISLNDKGKSDDETLGEKTPACYSLVPLGQLSCFDGNDLERHSDLLGE